MNKRPSALLLALLPAVVLAFWGKKTDEEKLKGKLDSLKVHLYLAGKAALTKTADSDEAKVVKERLLTVVGGTASSVKVLADQEAAPAAAQQAPGLSLKDVAGLGKALWGMRSVGKEVLSGDKQALPPLLPVLLTPLGVAPELVARLDAPTDHGVLFAALALVKLYPSSPVPIAPEIILYEGTHMDPAKVKIPGFAPQLHGLKGYTLAMSGMCDLAAKEALALDALGAAPNPEQLGAGLKLLTGKEVSLSPTQLEAVGASTEVLAQGSLSLCFMERAVWDKAQQSLGRFLDVAERSGLDEPELHLMRAATECGSKQAAKGKARLEALAARSDLSEASRDDLKYLRKNCDEEDAEVMQKVVSKARLGKAIARVSWEHLERSGLLDTLGALPWVQTLRDFVTALGQGISKVPGGIEVSLGGGGWD